MRGPTTSVWLFMMLLVVAALSPSPSAQSSSGSAHGLGPLASRRAALGVGTSRVIVTAAEGYSLPEAISAIQQAGGTVGRALPIVNAYVADIPNVALTGLANNPHIGHIALDRVVIGTMERTGATIGATAVRQELGYDGSGIGIAVIDSGVTAWHDDLAGADGSQRVDQFVDFVGGHTTAYDDYGHGTHVAGIIAGNGFDSGGARSGIAPGARLIVLKVLDSSGAGRISDVITALDYIVANKDALNIRVVNVSVASGVYESYDSDPLTLAAQRAVQAGIVVVAAAGNYGQDKKARNVYGGITAPGNAPWVLTVGASSHMGTVDRADDAMAAFSSHGPTAVDYAAKPDVVAPGVGIESLSDPDGKMYSTQSKYLLDGTVSTSYHPYLSQTGTSMAAPVVSGTVALMLQANPALTPNAVKAILQYTAQVYPDYDPLTEGAGFVNAKGAVALAQFFATPANAIYPASPEWGARMVWGNTLASGGRLMPDANAWSTDVQWGSDAASDGSPVTWGIVCSGTDCDAGAGIWAAWTTSADSRNVVWGSMCGGQNCQVPWSYALVSATIGDTVVWGTASGDTVVWGTTGGDTVVWGTTDGDTVVWGTSCSDDVCQPVIWN